MNRLLLINSVCGIRSTGRICADIAKEYEAKGWDVKIAYGRMESVPTDCRKYAVRIGNLWSVRFHVLLTRLFDWHGMGPCSYFATKKFLKWAEEWKPDVVWLHNIHGYYLNYPLLFQWIKRHPELEVRWTLHDCWAFTGHCSHFLLTDCSRWQKGCWGCPEQREYPQSWFFSNAKRNWLLKKRMFCGVKNMALIAPSKWLADLTRKSFLTEYPVQVVRNTIDTETFKPTASDFRQCYGLEDKKILLGVASSWDKRKGMVDFLRLRALLPSDFVLVLVGLAARQMARLPKGIVGIGRTNSKRELAEIYSAANWFFNPTREDNYPTVNLEAVACGCRVVTYDTGGAAETVEDVPSAIVLRGTDKSPEGFVKAIAETNLTQHD